MVDVNDFVARINAEFAAHREQASQLKSEQMQEHKDRQQRFESLATASNRGRQTSRNRFPKFAAVATLERDGKTLYFISEETRREFKGR